MADQELPDLDDIMLQNKENERKEAQKSQIQLYESSQPQPYQPPQPQPYQPPQPQPYQPPQPQPYHPPQTQPYEVSQPQAYQPPQSEFYQSPQPQTYQQAQSQPYETSQPQAYQQQFPQNQTPLYINPPVTNNMYQDGSNQSQNYVMNPNAIIDNHELFHDDIKATNKRRLKCQLFLVILLFLNIPLSIWKSLEFKNNNIYLLLNIIVDIFILIIGIWMIILTKRGQTTRNCCLGLISLIPLIILISKQFLFLKIALINIYDLFYIIIFIIVVSFNMKCKCCD